MHFVIIFILLNVCILQNLAIDPKDSYDFANLDDVPPFDEWTTASVIPGHHQHEMFGMDYYGLHTDREMQHLWHGNNEIQQWLKNDPATQEFLVTGQELQHLLASGQETQHLLDNGQATQHLLHNDKAMSSGHEMQYSLRDNDQLKDKPSTSAGKRASKKRRYSLEEKREIVANYNEMKAQNPAQSIRGIAKILEVPYKSLFEWIRGNRMTANGAGKPSKYSLGEKMNYVAKYDEIKAKNPQMTDDGIAKQLGTSRTNLYYWKRRNFGQITNASIPAE